MIVRGNSAAARTTRWDVMVTNLKPSVPDMPQIADDVANLDTMTTQARALASHRADLRSQLNKTTADLKEVLTEGDKLQARLGATLKGKFGFTDTTLVKYGIRPVVKRHSKKKGSPTPTPTPTPTGPEVKPAAAAEETVPPVPHPSGQ
jgi:hypothetical protein